MEFYCWGVAHRKSGKTSDVRNNRNARNISVAVPLAAIFLLIQCFPLLSSLVNP